MDENLIHDKSEFVNLSDFIPGVVVDMKYASKDNFIGRRVNGYKTNIAYLKKDAALALKNVQEELKSSGFSLIIYDAYRPQKATEDFRAWCHDPNDQINKGTFYPHVEKSLFFDLGFIAKKSSHTRGIAVDLSLISLQSGQALDMGGAFDLFDEISATINKHLKKEHLKNRMFLKAIMEKHGFENYHAEWWHYSLKNATNHNNLYDFDVE